MPTAKISRDGTATRVRRWLRPCKRRLMLLFPFLYRLPSIRYESSLTSAGVRELCALADRVASVPGAIIECGSAYAGSVILLTKHLQRQGRSRQLFALDSWTGFQRDELARERGRGLTIVPDNIFTTVSFKYVVAKLRKLNLADEIRPVQGYFQDTLGPLVAEAGQVAMAFIDCDLEESMRFCAETVWAAMPSGGIVAFDDYAEPADPYFHFKGCKLAVDAFVSEHQDEIADHGLMTRLYYVQKR